MATKKIRMRPEGTNDYADVLHPETSADNVLDTATKVIMTKTERDKLTGVESGARKLTNVLNEKQATKVEFDEHLADDVQHGKIGTKEVDESEISDEATLVYSAELGKWVVKTRPLDDLSGSPGRPYLISGTMEEGFFGEVSASEFITGDTLASQVGISQGTSQHSTAGWLKFAYNGKIQFVAKKPIRHSISWDAINTAKCVYGDSGDKTVVIGGKTYKVTLMKGANDKFNPKQPISGQTGGGNGHYGEVNHGSEWNRLMCQIHEKAIKGNWYQQNNIESDIGILKHSLGSGSQGMYSNADLAITGDGRGSWCQEMSTSTSHHLFRGSDNVSVSYESPSSTMIIAYGWRPVLRLIG